MSRNYAQAPLIEMAPSLLRKAEALCHKLEEHEGTVNVYPWLHRLGLEYICVYRPRNEDSHSGLLIMCHSHAHDWS